MCVGRAPGYVRGWSEIRGSRLVAEDAGRLRDPEPLDRSGERAFAADSAGGALGILRGSGHRRAHSSGCMSWSRGQQQRGRPQDPRTSWERVSEAGRDG